MRPFFIIMNIGNIEINSDIILAPMAGVTDLAYRLINREFGCACAVTEMVNIRALTYDNLRTLEIIMSDPLDKPLGIQLFERDSQYFKPAFERIKPETYDFIDFNAACPVKKIVNNGEGSALMKEPEHLQNLLKSLVDISPKPVTVKIRAGWDSENINAVEVAQRAEDAGVSAIFIHGRTKTQLYHGISDNSIIQKVKNTVSIPVIGSGDVFSPEAVVQMKKETNCDAVLLARGSYGNPWFFQQYKDFLETGEYSNPNISQVADIMLKHIKLLDKYYPRERLVYMFRKNYVWYTKGFPKVKHLRQKIFSLCDYDELLSAIDEFKII